MWLGEWNHCGSAPSRSFGENNQSASLFGCRSPEPGCLLPVPSVFSAERHLPAASRWQQMVVKVAVELRRSSRWGRLSGTPLQVPGHFGTRPPWKCPAGQPGGGRGGPSGDILLTHSQGPLEQWSPLRNVKKEESALSPRDSPILLLHLAIYSLGGSGADSSRAK